MGAGRRASVRRGVDSAENGRGGLGMVGYNMVELGRATLWKERLSGLLLLKAVMERSRIGPAPTPAAAAAADAGRRKACCDALCRAPYCLRKPIYAEVESGEAPMATRR